jgi:ABC-2 type transport system permease protein
MTAFLALLRRDMLVAARSAGPLLLATLTKPALVVLVFGNLLPRMGLVSSDFRTVVVPGLMAVTILMAGVQGVLMPLATDLSGSREVDERLLAPLSTAAVARERVVAGAVHAALGGLAALPIMMLLMHEMSGVAVHPSWPLLVPLVVVSGLLSASFGLLLGTLVHPRMSGLLFAIVIGPMMLFGCAYYPWMGLEVIGGARFAFFLNPLVFVSEAMRMAVTPDSAHMPETLLLPGLLGWLALLAALGVRQFRRRTIL